MKINSILKFFVVIGLLLTGLFVASELATPIKYTINKKFIKYSTKSSIKKIEAENLAYNSLDDKNLLPRKVIFDKNGIDNIALITMIKDEDDIIYENLVWHFAIGFRKFVIVDNNSIDKTRFLIEKFRDQTLGKAIVIIVDDPIIEYIQSEVTTGAMRLANSIWPHIEWIFPVDADEFWYPNIALKNILSSVPENKDIILVHQYNHFPLQNAKNFDFSKPFYENLKFRQKSIAPGLGKVAVRSKYDMVIDRGNHLASPINYSRNASYIAGNTLGLDMLHFQMRSVGQVERKYSNGAKANILAQKLGLVSKDHGVHWSAFAKEVEEKGLKQAAIDRFNSHIRPENQMVEDPLPMKKAFELFEEINKR